MQNSIQQAMWYNGFQAAAAAVCTVHCCPPCFQVDYSLTSQWLQHRCDVVHKHDIGTLLALQMIARSSAFCRVSGSKPNSNMAPGMPRVLSTFHCIISVSIHHACLNWSYLLVVVSAAVLSFGALLSFRVCSIALVEDSVSWFV